MAQWYYRNEPGSSTLNDEQSAALADSLNISPFLMNILRRRGLCSRKEIDSYLNPSLSGLVNPEKWPQIPEAADFLVKALLEGRQLAVWGDYDVDGTTSTAIVLDVLEFHGFHPLWHIPDRHTEGYGINVPAVEELAKKGCQVLLTVDSGISDVKAIKRARELGMDVVVSDHHLPPENLPPATFFFNPRMGDPAKVPCPHLAGVGVSFFLMAAVNARLGKKDGKHFVMDRVLDLVTLGTLADVMRLTGQNRILVHGGLKHLVRPERPGIAALKAVCGIGYRENVSATQVSFKLAPRINAAGRMRHAKIALELMRSTDHAESAELAQELDELNTTRRDTESIILDEARNQAREQQKKGRITGLVLYGKQWHPGVIGIVATRIIEEFNVPCIIVCDDKDTLKGSGRSIPGFDLYAGLAEIPEHLLAFGGHKQAAGVRILPGQLDAFRHDFEEMTRRRLGKQPEQMLAIDGELSLGEAANPEHLKELALMEPFGTGNAEPVFVSNPVEIVGRSTFRGRSDSVSLVIRDTVDGHTLRAKGWGLAQEIGQDKLHTVVRIAFTLRESHYSMNGPEITIRDWGPADKKIASEIPGQAPTVEDEEVGEDTDEIPS